MRVCVDTTDQTVYAIKILNKALLKKRKVVLRGADSDQWEQVKKEIDVLKKLHHENIIKLKEVQAQLEIGKQSLHVKARKQELRRDRD